ncbi:prophenin-2-like [Zonotrichia leucophrys gambelii]|uniref:prophenin-2-like n=1 Tax=Zonotrichia leucophrys gambelii TaxID=257770 RepID=UPI0031406D9C
MALALRLFLLLLLAVALPARAAQAAPLQVWRAAMEQKSMQVGPYPVGSNGFVPATDAGKDMGREVLGKSDTDAQNPRKTPRIICPQDVRRSCMIGTVVTLFTVPISVVLCYAGFRLWKGKKRRAAAAPASLPRRRASPSPPERPETIAFDSSHPRPRQPELPKKAEHQPSVPPPQPPSPALKRKPPEIPPPPPLPSPPPWSN